MNSITIRGSRQERVDVPLGLLRARLAPGTFKVWMRLLTLRSADVFATTFATKRWIQRRTNLSRTTVKRALRELGEWDLVQTFGWKPASRGGYRYERAMVALVSGTTAKVSARTLELIEMRGPRKRPGRPRKNSGPHIRLPPTGGRVSPPPGQVDLSPVGLRPTGPASPASLSTPSGEHGGTAQRPQAAPHGAPTRPAPIGPRQPPGSAWGRLVGPAYRPPPPARPCLVGRRPVRPVAGFSHPTRGQASPPIPPILSGPHRPSGAVVSFCKPPHIAQVPRSVPAGSPGALEHTMTELDDEALFDSVLTGNIPDEKTEHWRVPIYADYRRQLPLVQRPEAPMLGPADGDVRWVEKLCLAFTCAWGRLRGQRKVFHPNVTKMRGFKGLVRAATELHRLGIPPHSWAFEKIKWWFENVGVEREPTLAWVFNAKNIKSVGNAEWYRVNNGFGAQVEWEHPANKKVLEHFARLRAELETNPPPDRQAYDALVKRFTARDVLAKLCDELRREGFKYESAFMAKVSAGGWPWPM